MCNSGNDLNWATLVYSTTPCSPTDGYLYLLMSVMDDHSEKKEWVVGMSVTRSEANSHRSPSVPLSAVSSARDGSQSRPRRVTQAAWGRRSQDPRVTVRAPRRGPQDKWLLIICIGRFPLIHLTFRRRLANSVRLLRVTFACNNLPVVICYVAETNGGRVAFIIYFWHGRNEVLHYTSKIFTLWSCDVTLSFFFFTFTWIQKLLSLFFKSFEILRTTSVF